ncbi:MAG TPA: GAF domain-containing protein, partial [Chthonomonadaceae bacterium]|nr:GAF domain-containing protein [Chthonomonadaceae bacterium]
MTKKNREAGIITTYILPRRAGMSDDVQGLQQELHATEERLKLIARVTGVVVGAAPLSVQASDLAEQVRQVFGVDSCIIRILEGEDLVLLASAGIPEINLLPRIPADWGIARDILAQRRAFSVQDITRYMGMRPPTLQIRNPYIFQSYAGAPLCVEDRIVGVIGIYETREVRDFTQADLEQLQIVANHIAVSIVNDQLYQEVERQKRELEAQIAERKQLEVQLLQAQKMDSIGRLAGGVAHDFNNLLTAILGYTELAQMTLLAEDPVQSHLEQVQKAAERAANLTDQLLAFARKQIIEPQTLDLNHLALNLEKMLSRLIGEHILLVTWPAADLWAIRADAGQIEQVLVNLAINARDAMP